MNGNAVMEREVRNVSTANEIPSGAAALLRGVAEQLESRVDEIADMMVSTQQSEIPAYQGMHDESMLEDVRTISVAVVRMWLSVMATGRPVDETMLTPVIEGSRRRVAQGVDIESLLRAYRVGIRVMWREISGSREWGQKSLHEAIGPVVTWVLNFSDLMSTTVAAAYIEETGRLAREQEHRRSSLLNLILAGPSPERHQAPEEIDSPHCMIEVRVAENLPLSQLEDIGSVLARRAGAVLWTVRHSSVVAVVRLSDRLDRRALLENLGKLLVDPRIVAFGVGNRAQGPTETRQSHIEATEAVGIGPHLVGTGSRVYDYRALAPLIALLQDPMRARRFAETTLEPLAPILDRVWALETLDAYLSRQGRQREVAQVLNVHLNTVKYRLNELRPHLDAALTVDGDGAATLLLAIRVRQYLSVRGVIAHV
jgi:hypothetical protein